MGKSGFGGQITAPSGYDAGCRTTGLAKRAGLLGYCCGVKSVDRPFRTGDIGVKDEHGFLHVIGRADALTRQVNSAPSE